MVYERYQGPKIKAPSDVAPILQAILKSTDDIDKDKEHLWVVGLNGANKVLYVELTAMGIMDQCHVHPREVYRRAIEKGCGAIILGHNHPSGDLLPSKENVDVTNRIKAAGELLGIPMIDHLIITETGFYSFTEHA